VHLHQAFKRIGKQWERFSIAWFAKLEIPYLRAAQDVQQPWTIDCATLKRSTAMLSSIILAI
jgi:hypothetical protein